MKIRFFKSLRNKLFGWYIGSLIVLSIFFYAVVHILRYQYGTEIFFLLFFLLGVIGFVIIYRITNDLTYLTGKIKKISLETLDERIEGIQREDEIGDLATAFNNLLNRLDEAFKREQQFIADVAHEMKTPIATMRSALEVSISKERSKEEYRQVINASITETHALSSSLNDILDLAWSQTPNEQKNAANINLSELLEELSDIASKLAKPKNQIIDIHIGQNLIIEGYKDKLAKAVINILENAIKYTPCQGKIKISTTKKMDKVSIKISDTGQGILPQDIPHIFDRFYRGSQTDKVFGSGIGLSIAYSVIKLHHGELYVKSKPGQWTTFTIVLPILRAVHTEKKSM